MDPRNWKILEGGPGQDASLPTGSSLHCAAPFGHCGSRRLCLAGSLARLLLMEKSPFGCHRAIVVLPRCAPLACRRSGPATCLPFLADLKRVCVTGENSIACDGFRKRLHTGCMLQVLSETDGAVPRSRSVTIGLGAQNLFYKTVRCQRLPDTPHRVRVANYSHHRQMCLQCVFRVCDKPAVRMRQPVAETGTLSTTASEPPLAQCTAKTTSRISSSSRDPCMNGRHTCGLQ